SLFQTARGGGVFWLSDWHADLCDFGRVVGARCQSCAQATRWDVGGLARCGDSVGLEWIAPSRDCGECAWFALAGRMAAVAAERVDVGAGVVANSGWFGSCLSLLQSDIHGHCVEARLGATRTLRAIAPLRQVDRVSD